jgi:hypothetical protein
MKYCKYQTVRIVPQSNRGMHKNKKYHTVRTVPQSNREMIKKTQNTTLSEQLLNPI